MRRVRVGLFAIGVLVFGLREQRMTAEAATDWPALAHALKKSVVYVHSESGSCTGFIIDSQAKNDKDRLLTDDHCIGEKMYADGAAAKVIWKDPHHDLMVLEVDDTGRPALPLAKADPVQGQEIVSYGFGYALSEPMFRHAHVANAAIIVPEVPGGAVVMIDAGYVAGQSGGPCVNAAGEVVSIVQRASNLVGVGVGAVKIRDRAGRYFEKVKP